MPLPGSRYLALVRRDGVPRPLVSSMLGRVADSIASVAIVVLVHSTTGSYSTAGAAAAAFAIGTAVGAPIAGRALDTAGPRLVLPALAGGFALALTALALAASEVDDGWLLCLASAAGLMRPPMEAALRALWPRLVPPGSLDSAYALDSTLQELVWIGGPLLLAILLAAGTAGLPLLACGALSVVGAAWYASAPNVPERQRHRQPDRRGPLSSSGFRTQLATGAAYGVADGILIVALAAFSSARGSSAAVGVLVAVWGAGSLVGGIAYGSRDWKRPVEQRALCALAAFGAALMLLAAAPSLLALGVLMLVLGLPLSPWLGCLSAAVQRAAPTGAAAEAFAWIFAAITLGMASGNAIGGTLIQSGGPDAAFLAAGAAALVGVGFGLTRLRAASRVSARRPSAEPGPQAGIS